ncbi:ankyrin repeat domain-containing protein [Dyella sp.]|uniref:ankyrin repeat domain-containing protein n=1 Tax=Dyella sp. TaxID=1869338 RepID=UPI002ED4EB7C
MTLFEILADYQTLPEYSGIRLVDVHQKSLFNDCPFNIAATRGAIKEMEVLLSNDADINCKGEHNYTPLHNAVEQGHAPAVRWLLERGADINAKTDDGLTPQDLARYLGQPSMEQLLGEHDATNR